MSGKRKTIIVEGNYQFGQKSWVEEKFLAHKPESVLSQTNGEHTCTCCIDWMEATNDISVVARDTHNPQSKYMAETLEKMLKHIMGNYCPTCGTKLK